MKAKKITGWVFSLLFLVAILNHCALAVPKLNTDFLKRGLNGSILVAEKGKILLRKGYGKADFEKRIPNTPATNFRLGSLTKQFTAMSILILEEKGKLSVNDRISKYISDYPHGDRITIHNLLTHTSGIAEHTTPELFANADRYYSPEDLISLFKNHPLRFTPGERFEYCNSNYILLGTIIERVSGLKYGDFIKQYIFGPLDMKDTGYDESEASFKNKAIGYQSLELRPIKADYLDMSIPYAAGGIRSTIDDLYKWDQALYTEKLVKADTLKKMFTPYSQTINYGYGWFIESSTFYGMHHSGGIHGFCSFIYRDTSKHLVLIILSNVEGQNLGVFKSYLDL